MIRRLSTILAVTALALGMFAGAAVADDEHPHVLLIGVSFEGGLTYDKCVDLGNGRNLPLQSLHNNVHAAEGYKDGKGVNVRGIRTAGHAVAPFTCGMLQP